MTPTLTRRGLLAAGAALASLPLIPARARAASDARRLVATTRTLDVRGRAVSVMGLLGPDGRPGLTLDPGERFRVDLVNDLTETTIVHWHGQIPPHGQDGVPDAPMPVLAPDEARSFDFAPRTGTHWMHSHLPLQEMALLAAPLVVRRAEDEAEDWQEVVMFLHDLSFDPPEAVLARLGIGGGMAGMDHGAPAAPTHDMGAMTGMAGMAAMDVNDIAFDAYLANDCTLDDPDVVAVEPGGRVRLRVINAAAATAFWIDTGAVPARLVAVDGEDVEPVAGTRFGLAMGQRLDLLLDLPARSGAFPILALREAATERAGLILATPGAAVPRVPVLGDAPAPILDLALEAELRALNPLAERLADRAPMLMLEGSMSPYLWTIDGRSWPDAAPTEARTSERVELTFHNMSMMAHPMHLHGHAFQVIDVGRGRFRGAVRDTVLVPPMAAVTVAFDAGEAADWMLHCHHMPHLATGMMTALRVSA